MSALTPSNQNKGFTIVELLIVIVIIAILATITIVAYSGITAKANTTKAQTNAVTLKKVLEAYNAEFGYYPYTISQITGYNASTKLPSGITVLRGPGGARLRAIADGQKLAAVRWLWQVSPEPHGHSCPATACRSASLPIIFPATTPPSPRSCTGAATPTCCLPIG